MQSRKVKAVAFLDLNPWGQSRKCGRSYQQVALRGAGQPDSSLQVPGYPLATQLQCSQQLWVQGSPQNCRHLDGQHGRAYRKSRQVRLRMSLLGSRNP